MIAILVLLFTFVEANFYLHYVMHYPPTPNTVEFHLRGDSFGLTWGAQGQRILRPSISMSKQTIYTAVLPLPNQSFNASFKAIANQNSWQVGANEMLHLSGVPTANVTFDSYPFFGSGKGVYTVPQVSFFSKALGNSRQIAVFVPPSYNENPYKQYPLLVMHDGQNVFNASTSFLGHSWRASQTIDKLIVEGNMEEIVVVAIYNTADRTDDYTYIYDPTVKTGGKADDYLDLIELKILPWMRNHIRLDQQIQPGMLGSSLGGLLSCYAGWTRSTYGKLGCMSSSFWWADNNFNTSVVGQHPPFPPTSRVFYMDSGDSSQSGCKPPQNCDDRLQTIDVYNHMQRLGWTADQNLFYYLQKGGVHNEVSWSERFHIPMSKLYAPRVQHIHA